MELLWLPSTQLSAFHAAHAAALGQKFVRPELAHALSAPAIELERAGKAFGIEPHVLWRAIFSFAHDLPSPRELAERLIRRLIPQAESPSLRDQLAANLADCKAPLNEAFPRLAEELPLRIGPLQTMWEARGPGLMRLISKLTEEDFIAESAVVFGVQPVLGGGGEAHLSTNRVHLEALLTDAHPQLPETLRLAWLLSQLQVDRPIYGEQVNSHDLPAVAARALLPIVLSAGEELQMTDTSPPSIRLALSMWLHVSEGDLEREQQVISAWWDTQAAARFAWGTAIAALDKMRNASSQPLR